ncbi:hypothetical protein SLS62_001027 [Diatrype stigma]|uniref:Uncharacterized protein n=1 Tax=Diatrype stigma TaxID=117547 RepID=A0AAN9YU24_9PEZI
MMAEPMEITGDSEDHSVPGQLWEAWSDDSGHYYLEEVSDDEVIADLVGEVEEATTEEDEDMAEVDNCAEEYEVEVLDNVEDDPAMETLTRGRGSVALGTKRHRSSESPADPPKKRKVDGSNNGAKGSLKSGSSQNDAGQPTNA